MSKKPENQDEHPLANILVNVLIPVVVLSFLSKDPELQSDPKPWHIGPLWAMVLALVLPIGYGVHFAIKQRKVNFFSALGLVSVLLTGGLTLHLWNGDGSVKDNAGLLFGIKEAMIPLVLGVAVLMSHRRSTPLIRVFLYNDSLFDIAKIEKRVDELGAEEEYEGIIRGATRLFATSFFLSALMNLGLAQWFFRDFDPGSAKALEEFNSIVGRIMGWGFAVIGVPILVFLFLTLRKLMKDLRRLTGFKDEELMLPR
ncbi:MAG: VC0807 family protein [Akkermansiaceae bacterium]|nr:VC0807 family protein [Akkermansiaceae bacterium]